MCELRRDIKGPLPVRVRLRGGTDYQVFCPVSIF